MKYFLLLFTTMFLIACTVEPKKKVPEQLLTGQVKFHEVCANCHGPDAMGGNKAPNLIQSKFVSSSYSDQSFFKTIINGSNSGSMPSQKRKVSEKEIFEIIKYIRHSQKDAGLN